MPFKATNDSDRFAVVAGNFQSKIQAGERLVSRLRCCAEVLGIRLGAFQVSSAAARVCKTIPFVAIIFVTSGQRNGPTTLFFIARDSCHGWRMTTVPGCFHSGGPPLSIDHAGNLSKGFGIGSIVVLVYMGYVAAVNSAPF